MSKITNAPEPERVAMPDWYGPAVERIYADALAGPRLPGWTQPLTRQLAYVTDLADFAINAERNAALLRGELGLS